MTTTIIDTMDIVITKEKGIKKILNNKSLKETIIRFMEKSESCKGKLVDHDNVFVIYLDTDRISIEDYNILKIMFDDKLSLRRDVMIVNKY